MNFGFSEDQELIRKSARDFVAGESKLERVREMQADDRGYSPELWKQMADNGWLGAVYPEEYGGLGLGHCDLICIAEEFGKGLMPEPLVSCVVLAGSAILLGGTEEQKESLLPPIASGELVATLGAYELAGRYDLSHCETRAEASNGGYILNGEKTFVPIANSADTILVTARVAGSSGDLTLFAIDREATGVSLTALSMLDRRKRFTVRLENVAVGADDVIGPVGGALPMVEAAADRATAILCAEMVGGMEEALRRTTGYAHERVQFGKPIGSFQAVKHRCADMYITLEVARSSTYYAAMAIDEGRDDVRSAVSSAKALCSDGYVKVAKDAIQLHGGIGFTHEHDIHLFYMHALADNATFGDGAYHRERFAKELGFGGGVREEDAAVVARD